MEQSASGRVMSGRLLIQTTREEGTGAASVVEPTDWKDENGDNLHSDFIKTGRFEAGKHHDLLVPSKKTLAAWEKRVWEGWTRGQGHKREGLEDTEERRCGCQAPLNA